MSRMKFDVRYDGLLSMGYEAKDISNRDLDDLMFSGVFYGYNIINAPDINYIQAIITRHNESWIVQECKDYLDRIYLRSYKDGVWGGWTELVVAHNCNEPDKEFIIVERPHSHPIATPQSAGFISAEDKAKLDRISQDGTIVPGDHIHAEYEERFDNIEAQVNNLDILKADKEHNHDDVYIPAFSSIRPTNQNIRGQVWIEIE